jgi:hypothetical protein
MRRFSLIKRAFHRTGISQSEVQKPSPKSTSSDPFANWLKNEGKQYKAPIVGPNYVSQRPDLPFPMNPLFRTVPPLADATREEIFRMHQEDKKENSIPRLAYRYNISADRVNAIIKLKTHEKQCIKQGIPLQVSFQTKMESMLKTQNQRKLIDVKHIQPIRAQPPYLLALNEEEVFDKEVNFFLELILIFRACVLHASLSN